MDGLEKVKLFSDPCSSVVRIFDLGGLRFFPKKHHNESEADMDELID